MNIFSPKYTINATLVLEGSCYLVQWECPVCHTTYKVEAVEWLADYTLPESPRECNAHCGRVDYVIRLVSALPKDFWKVGEAHHGRRFVQ